MSITGMGGSGTSTHFERPPSAEVFSLPPAPEDVGSTGAPVPSGTVASGSALAPLIASADPAPPTGAASAAGGPPPAATLSDTTLTAISQALRLSPPLTRDEAMDAILPEWTLAQAEDFAPAYGVSVQEAFDFLAGYEIASAATAARYPGLKGEDLEILAQAAMYKVNPALAFAELMYLQSDMSQVSQDTEYGKAMQERFGKLLETHRSNILSEIFFHTGASFREGRNLEQMRDSFIDGFTTFIGSAEGGGLSRVEAIQKYAEDWFQKNGDLFFSRPNLFAQGLRLNSAQYFASAAGWLIDDHNRARTASPISATT